MKNVTVHIPNDIYAKLSELVSQGYFQSMAEAIRFAVFRYLSELLNYKKGEMTFEGNGGGESVIMSVKIPKFLLEVARELAENLGFKSRAELIRYLIVDAMLNYVKRDDET